LRLIVCCVGCVVCCHVVVFWEEGKGGCILFACCVAALAVAALRAFWCGCCACFRLKMARFAAGVVEPRCSDAYLLDMHHDNTLEVLAAPYLAVFLDKQARRSFGCLSLSLQKKQPNTHLAATTANATRLLSL
jgi:hypothetical protein